MEYQSDITAMNKRLADMSLDPITTIPDSNTNPPAPSDDASAEISPSIDNMFIKRRRVPLYLRSQRKLRHVDPRRRRNLGRTMKPVLRYRFPRRSGFKASCVRIGWWRIIMTKNSIHIRFLSRSKCSLLIMMMLVRTIKTNFFSLVWYASILVQLSLSSLFWEICGEMGSFRISQRTALVSVKKSPIAWGLRMTAEHQDEESTAQRIFSEPSISQYRAGELVAEHNHRSPSISL